MRDSIITGIFASGGIIIGTVISWITSYLHGKRERKDRYFFAMMKERFEVNQQAFYYADKLKKIIHGDDSTRIKVVNEANEWFIKHNFYMSPEVREKFQNTVLDVDFYKHKLENYRETKRSEGPDSDKTKREKKELNEIFEGIMKGLQAKIQEDIDLYYQYLKKDK